MSSAANACVKGSTIILILSLGLGTAQARVRHHGVQAKCPIAMRASPDSNVARRTHAVRDKKHERHFVSQALRLQYVEAPQRFLNNPRRGRRIVSEVSPGNAYPAYGYPFSGPSRVARRPTVRFYDSPYVQYSNSPLAGFYGWYGRLSP